MGASTRIWHWLQERFPHATDLRLALFVGLLASIFFFVQFGFSVQRWSSGARMVHFGTSPVNDEGFRIGVRVCVKDALIYGLFLRQYIPGPRQPAEDDRQYLSDNRGRTLSAKQLQDILLRIQDVDPSSQVNDTYNLFDVSQFQLHSKVTGFTCAFFNIQGNFTAPPRAQEFVNTLTILTAQPPLPTPQTVLVKTPRFLMVSLFDTSTRPSEKEAMAEMLHPDFELPLNADADSLLINSMYQLQYKLSKYAIPGIPSALIDAKTSYRGVLEYTRAHQRMFLNSVLPVGTNGTNWTAGLMQVAMRPQTFLVDSYNSEVTYGFSQWVVDLGGLISIIAVVLKVLFPATRVEPRQSWITLAQNNTQHPLHDFPQESGKDLLLSGDGLALPQWRGL